MPSLALFRPIPTFHERWMMSWEIVFSSLKRNFCSVVSIQTDFGKSDMKGRTYAETICSVPRDTRCCVYRYRVLSLPSS
jgi:hypothetical protein